MASATYPDRLAPERPTPLCHEWWGSCLTINWDGLSIAAVSDADPCGWFVVGLGTDTDDSMGENMAIELAGPEALEELELEALELSPMRLHLYVDVTLKVPGETNGRSTMTAVFGPYSDRGEAERALTGAAAREDAIGARLRDPTLTRRRGH